MKRFLALDATRSGFLRLRRPSQRLSSQRSMTENNLVYRRRAARQVLTPTRFCTSCSTSHPPCRHPRSSPDSRPLPPPASTRLLPLEEGRRKQAGRSLRWRRSRRCAWGGGGRKGGRRVQARGWRRRKERCMGRRESKEVERQSSGSRRLDGLYKSREARRETG